MKKFILLLLVFIFVYPIFPEFLPIPLDRILQLCGMGVLFLYNRDFRRILSNKAFYAFYGATGILLFLTLLAQLQSINGFDLYLFKEVLDAFLYLFSAYLLCWMMLRIYGRLSIGLLLYYISLAALLQTLISFIFFFNSSLFDFYISLLKEETNQRLFDRTSVIGKRFIGFGSNFFTGVLKYGVAFLSILVLPYVHHCRLTNNKLIYWLSVTLIAIGGILTGRTFFVAIAIGLFMIILLNSKNLLSFIFNNIKASIGVLIAFLFLYAIAANFMEAERFENMFNFVFELFINFFELNSLETGSTNRMQEMFFFPDNLNTWIFGDGRMFSNTGGYYMHTDIGFIRLLFYFGLPSTIYFIYLHYVYYKILSKETHVKALKYLFLFMLIWILTLNFKGLVFESKYIVIFLLIFILQKKHRKYVS